MNNTGTGTNNGAGPNSRPFLRLVKDAGRDTHGAK